MWRESSHIRQGVIGALDAVAIYIGFVAAVGIRNYLLASNSNQFPLSEQWPVFAIMVPSYLLAFQGLGVYGQARKARWLEEVWLVGKGALVGTTAVFAAVFLLRVEFTSRLIIGLTGVLSVFLVLGVHLVLRLEPFRRLQLGYPPRNILVVGPPARAQLVLDALRAEESASGFRLLNSVRCVELAESLNCISSLEGREGIDEVLLAVDLGELILLEDLISYCMKAGITMSVCATLFPRLAGVVRLDMLGGLPLLTLGASRHTPVQLFLKRLFDVGVSGALLILLAPLFALSAVLIKLTSTGPVFHKQVRVGLQGRRFVLYKFRTMLSGAEQMKAELLSRNEMDGPVFKIRDDPRVTPVGRLLRRTSLDELPQLVNVLKGEMSLVGPRPPLPEEVVKYDLWQRRRLSVRPGITCLWQVSGRNDIDFNSWMKLDLEYIDNWSWKLDFIILLRTFPAIFRGV